jgi:hypothetical protein
MLRKVAAAARSSEWPLRGQGGLGKLREQRIGVVTAAGSGGGNALQGSVSSREARPRVPTLWLSGSRVEDRGADERHAGSAEPEGRYLLIAGL